MVRLASLVARLGPQWIAPAGALAVGCGLFSVGSWQPGTPPLFMMLSLALQGIGTGLFQEVLANAAVDFVTVESVLVLERQPEPELRAQEPPQ